MNKLCFFFGSGISLSAGMPISDTITQEVLNGKYTLESASWTPNVDDLFKSSTRDCRESIVIKRLLTEICYITKTHHNYEELFGIVEFLAKNNFTKTLSEPFMEKLYKRIPAPEGEALNYTEWRDKVKEIANMASFYIQSVVFNLLNTTPLKENEHIKGLAPLGEVSKLLDELDIFTLNHDLLIENEIQGIADGFVETEKYIKGVGEFKNDFTGKKRLYKLHGSINWIDVHDHIDSPRENPYTHGLSHKFTIKDNSPFSRPEERRSDRLPNFITGTQKEKNYSQGILADLFYQQKKVWEKYKTIIFCGYGFNDEGINKRIEQWLSSDATRNRKIILLDKGSLNKHPFIKRIRSLNSKERIKTHNKWLSECSPKELLQMAR